MNAASYREFIEERILDVIETGLENGSLTTKRAEEISGLVLNALSETMTIDQLYVAIQKLKYAAPEVIPAVSQAMDRYDEIQKDKVLRQIKTG